MGTTLDSILTSLESSINLTGRTGTFECRVYSPQGDLIKTISEKEVKANSRKVLAAYFPTTQTTREDKTRTINCEYCQALFIATSLRQKFCTKSCRKDHEREKRRAS